MTGEQDAVLGSSRLGEGLRGWASQEKEECAETALKEERGSMAWLALRDVGCRDGCLSNLRGEEQQWVHSPRQGAAVGLQKA